MVQWHYLWGEATHRCKRTALTSAGIAMAVALVVLLDLLGRAFADVSTLPFRNLSTDLIVQRAATQSALPKQMGIMLPYSAQPITDEELMRLSAEEDVEQAAGFVLLWNFGSGRFFSISGIPHDDGTPTLGPGKARDWLIKGRLPARGARELLVERHYGAFYRLEPGSTVDLGGTMFEVAGVIDIKEGSQLVASNFYMDIDQARHLAALPPNTVNQVLLKVAQMERTEAVKTRIAGWLPRASVMSPDTMLGLFGGISSVVGRFRLATLLGGGLAALALVAVLIYGALQERRKDIALLRTLGWTRRQVHAQLIAETALQGIAGGLLGLILVAVGVSLLGTVSLSLPASLPGENPADFLTGSFRSAPESIRLPILVTNLHWLLPPAVAGAMCALLGGWISSRQTLGSLWASSKAV